MMDDPLVRGDTYLRQVEEKDLAILKQWRNDWAIRSVTREYRLLTDADQAQWYESLAKKPPEHLMFVIESRGVRLGCCGLTYIDFKNRNAEVSIYIGEEVQREKGVGGSVLRMLEDYAFGELGLHKIWAEVYSWNTASQKLFESFGYALEARIPSRVWRDGKFHVGCFYGRYFDDWLDYRKKEGAE